MATIGQKKAKASKTGTYTSKSGKVYTASGSSSSSQDSQARGLATQLQGLVNQAKGTSIDTRRYQDSINQTMAEGSKAFKGSSYDKGDSFYNTPIKADQMGIQPMNIPPEAPEPDYTPILNQAYGEITDPSTDVAEGDNALSQYIKMTQNAPDETAQLMDLNKKLEKDAQLKQKREAVNNYQGQLNQIVASAQAQNLAMEGAGRGQTTGFIGGEQARVNREAAIQALPVQAQLSAAQGDLEMAQAHVDKMFGIYSKSIENSVNRYYDMTKVVYDYTSKKEQQQLDAKLAQKKFEQNVLSADMDNQNSYMNLALKNGQTGAFSALSNIRPPLNVNSPTYARDYAQYKAEVAKTVAKYNVVDKDAALDRQYKQAQISKMNADMVSLRTANNPEAFDGFLNDVEVKKIDASPQGKKITALGDLKQKLNTYKELVSKYGTETPLGGQKKIIDSAYADAKIAWKEAANLGALTGPDLGLIEDAIPEATYGGFFAPLKRFAGVSSGNSASKVIGALEQSLKTTDLSATKNIGELYARNPLYSSSWYVQELTKPFAEKINLSESELNNAIDQLSPDQIQELKDAGLI